MRMKVGFVGGSLSLLAFSVTAFSLSDYWAAHPGSLLGLSVPLSFVSMMAFMVYATGHTRAALVSLVTIAAIIFLSALL